MVGLFLLLVWVVVFRILLPQKQQRSSFLWPGVAAVLCAALLLRLFFFSSSSSSPLRLTRAQLAKYTGADGGPIFLAVKGRIYDVSTGRDHYGPGRHEPTKRKKISFVF